MHQSNHEGQIKAGPDTPPCDVVASAMDSAVAVHGKFAASFVVGVLGFAAEMTVKGLCSTAVLILLAFVFD